MIKLAKEVEFMAGKKNYEEVDARTAVKQHRKKGNKFFGLWAYEL